ncbi:MAG: hypothetical protein ACTHMS_11425 [Jatrophihabitans sp.]|uniref:hypothetical protein n=1 Tax=Jatrophihabitans sp. TaxID=1932789 RepID=UPI003F7F0574
MRPATVTTRPPVQLHSVADFGTGVTARITAVKAVTVEGVGAGEISGPGLNLTIVLTNNTRRAIDLDNSVVTLTDADGHPAALMTFTPDGGQGQDDDVPAPDPASFTHAFRGSLAPHRTATATYVFTVPTGHRNPITVNLSYAGSQPTVIFRGNAE